MKNRKWSSFEWIMILGLMTALIVSLVLVWWDFGFLTGLILWSKAIAICGVLTLFLKLLADALAKWLENKRFK